MYIMPVLHVVGMINNNAEKPWCNAAHLELRFKLKLEYYTFTILGSVLG